MALTTEYARWRSVVRNAYHALTEGRYVDADFPEPTMAQLMERGDDEATAVLFLVRSKGVECSVMDAMLATDKAMQKLGIS